MPEGMSDFLMALAVVDRRVAAEGRAMTLIVAEPIHRTALALTSLPTVCDRRATARDRRHTIRRVRRECFSHLYVLRDRSAWFVVRSGVAARNRRTMPSRLYRRFFGTGRRGLGVCGGEHISRVYCNLLDMPYRDPSEWQGEHIDGDPDYRGAMVLCPGSGKGPNRNGDEFTLPAQRCADRKVVMLGTREDAERCRETAECAPGRIVNLCGAVTMIQAARILASASVVVSNNTRLLHLAGYLGTPWVGLFRAVDPLEQRPLGPAGVLLCAGEADTADCGDARYGRHRVVKGISGEAVLRCIGELTGKEAEGRLRSG